ncbi:MAG: ATP-binding protein [Bacteroidia bacterium]
MGIKEDLEAAKNYSQEATREKLWTAESHISMVRLFVLLCCSVVYHTILDDSLKIPWLATFTMILAFPFSAIMILYKPYKKYPLLLSRVFSVASDGLFIVMWIYATGGTDSPFHSLWFLSIIAVAQRFTFMETIIVSIIYMLAYFLILVSNPAYIVPTVNLVVRLMFIPITGILGAYFSREVADQINDKVRIRESELKIRKIVDELNIEMGKKNEAELQLKQTQLQLERKVEERTNDYRILNEQLKKLLREKEKIQLEQEKTLQRLEYSNKELESFAYITSHDLKAPLRGIATIAEWLNHDYANKLDDEGRNNLLLLKQRAQKMNDLIEGILQYSRIGKTNFQAEKIDLFNLINEVVRLLQPRENISIIISDNLPLLHINKILLIQVLENLLSNAINHMDDQGGKIIVDAIKKQNEYVFFIMDTGPGIDARYHEKIFEMFQTLHPEKKSENTGIGLAIVKKIVNNFGGRVWVESEPGKGSSFYFSFPNSMIKKHEQLQAN